MLGSSSPISSSSQAPLPVNGGFSVILSEANYSAGFTASIASYTAPTTQSCYTVAMDGTGTVATFTPRASAAISGGATSPCTQLGTDIEGAVFEDQQKHAAELYFQNTAVPLQGSIQVRVANTATVINTTPSMPLIVSNGFALTVSEPNYSGPFTAAIISFTAPAVASCYTVSMDPTGTVATFAPRASTAIAASGAPSPCIPPSSDIEAVLFADQRGNAAEVYFENEPLSVPAAIQARFVTTGSVLATSLANPMPVNGAFSVSLSEPNYVGPFVATIISYTAPTQGPCYSLSMDPTQTIVTFTPRAAPPLSGGASAPSPCAAPSPNPSPDVEGVLFEDQRGNFNEQFFSH